MKKKQNFFWPSYSDLMTSLFFIMLVLFILVVVILNKQKSVYKTKAEEYDKIMEIKESLNNIDTNYFIYNKDYKKHILKIPIHFRTGRSGVNDIVDKSILKDLDSAGIRLQKKLQELIKADTSNKIQYLIVIEGQASKDNYTYNNELSYQRALTLKNYWISKNVRLDTLKNCELIVSGSGIGGIPREEPDIPPKNQRFLIHIIPKTGEIEYYK